MDPAFEVVDEVIAHTTKYDAEYGIAFHRLLPFLRPGNVDAVYERLTPRLKATFLRDARLQLLVYPEVTVPRTDAGAVDAKHWLAMYEWLYRQPIELAPPAPLPPPNELKKLGIFQTFLRVLPHLALRPVETVIVGLPPFTRTELARFAVGLRPGIDVIVANCRARGQDPTPFVKLMEWEATRPRT